MVTKNPKASEGLYLETSGMAAGGAFTTAEDPTKKIRKPYTITKSRESWTEPEHDKFLEALHLFDRDWKKIEAFVGSKTVIQIRSHAQKYFLKAQKNGTGERLPPPRPKRKAAHPYPQKAPKNAPVLSQAPGSYLLASARLEPGCGLRPDSTSMPTNHVAGAIASSWTNSLSTGLLATKNCCSSTESNPRIKPTSDMPELGNNNQPLRVLPDFAQVYGFIGSVFDTNTTGHLQKLKKMDTIDVDTVLLLMRNLSINLTSPDFEDHRRLISSYDLDDAMDASEMLDDDQSKNVA